MNPAHVAMRTARPRPRGSRSRRPSSDVRSGGAPACRALVSSPEERGSDAAARAPGKNDPLFSVAEIGYHYLRNGGYRAAEALFQGLVSLEPRQPYFWLALGLTRDHLGDTGASEDHYRRAARYGPADPVPLVNLAELALERGDRRRARSLLQRARASARFCDDTPIATKVAALLRLSAEEKR